VARIFPPGTYTKMMHEAILPMMYGGMVDILRMPAAQLANLTGLMPDDLAARGEGTISDAMAIMDPAYKARSTLVMNVSMGWVAALMNQAEPSYRANLARAFAVRFPEAELDELNSFFATPTGSHYAAESILISIDPQVTSAMNEMISAVMESLPDMMASVTEATAGMPEARIYLELSANEQAKLSAILGVSHTELDRLGVYEMVVEVVEEAAQISAAEDE